MHKPSITYPSDSVFETHDRKPEWALEVLVFKLRV